MRPMKRETGGPESYNAELCRATRRMRDRMKHLLERIEALELQLRLERADMADERAELVAHMEGPEAARDVLLIAQDLLQTEMIQALAGPDKRAVCRYCGGLGHGMTKGLLVERINSLCREHGLPASAAPIDPKRWPNVSSGYGRNYDWHRPKEKERSLVW